MQCVVYITAKPKSLAQCPQHLVYMPCYLCKIRPISVGNDRVMPQSVIRQNLMTEIQRGRMRVRVEACKNHRDPAVRKGVRDPNIFHVFVFLGSTIIVDCINKLTLSDQTQLTLQLAVSLSDLVLRFLAIQLLLRARNSFLPGPKPALGSAEPRPYGILGGQTGKRTCFSLCISAFPYQHCSTSA